MTKINGWDFLKLINGLRRAGINISMSQVEDAWIALNRFPDLPAKNILEAMLIYRSEDQTLFQLIYNLTINPPQEESSPQNIEGAPLPSSPEVGPPQEGLGTGRGGITLALMSDDSSQSSSQPPILSFQMPLLHNLMHLKGFPSAVDHGEKKEENIEQQVRFILGQVGFLTWANSVELARKRGQLTEQEWARFEEFKEYWEKELRNILWQEEVKKQNNWESLRQVNWRYKPLDSFSPQEEGILHQALRQMGNTLAVHRGLRKRKSIRGTLQVSSILKEAFRGNGKIFSLHYEDYVLKHPELVILCDVSNSVAPFAQFLIYLCQRIKSYFRRVRIYLFIDTIWDITNEEWLNQEGNLEEIRSWGRKNSSGFSDYGKTFQEFAQNYLPEISSKATLLILGDGRSNFRPPQKEYLQKISSKVKHIYWLNPLEEKDWYRGDSLMREYQEFSSKTFPCRTINDLWQITRKVFI